MVGGTTDVENFDLESRASARTKEKEGRGRRLLRERRDIGEKTTEHGGAWQHGYHGGDKYRV